MAQPYEHLREKAIELRTQHRMTLDDIVERLALPITTVYYWIGDIPLPWTEKQIKSGQLSGRQFRSQYDVLSVHVGDTYLRARLQAWMDIIKAQW